MKKLTLDHFKQWTGKNHIWSNLFSVLCWNHSPNYQLCMSRFAYKNTCCSRIDYRIILKIQRIWELCYEQFSDPDKQGLRCPTPPRLSSPPPSIPLKVTGAQLLRAENTDLVRSLKECVCVGAPWWWAKDNLTWCLANTLTMEGSSIDLTPFIFQTVINK